MNNPWQEQAAFAPMFCDVVKIDGVRGNGAFQSSVKACVFPAQDVDPFDGASADSDMQSIVVIVPKAEQTGAPVKCQVQIGDTLTLDDSTAWKASDISTVEKYWKIEARSI